jgi:hypothetical protein
MMAMTGWLVNQAIGLPVVRASLPVLRWESCSESRWLKVSQLVTLLVRRRGCFPGCRRASRVNLMGCRMGCWDRLLESRKVSPMDCSVHLQESHWVRRECLSGCRRENCWVSLRDRRGCLLGCRRENRTGCCPEFQMVSCPGCRKESRTGCCRGFQKESQKGYCQGFQMESQKGCRWDCCRDRGQEHLRDCLRVRLDRGCRRGFRTGYLMDFRMDCQRGYPMVSQMDFRMDCPMVSQRDCSPVCPRGCWTEIPMDRRAMRLGCRTGCLRALSWDRQVKRLDCLRGCRSVCWESRMGCRMESRTAYWESRTGCRMGFPVCLDCPMDCCSAIRRWCRWESQALPAWLKVCLRSSLTVSPLPDSTLVPLGWSGFRPALDWWSLPEVAMLPQVEKWRLVRMY